MKVDLIEHTDEFIVLEVSDEGLPKKRISVHIDAIADGVTTLEEQIDLALEDGKLRLKRIKAMEKALKKSFKT